MHVEYLKTHNPERARGYPSEVEHSLVGLDGTIHDSLAAEVCCAASVWAYSDLTTFASVLCRRKLYGEFLSVNVTNEPAFVNTTAFLFLSESKRLAILAFRGTEPLDIISCLAAINTKLVPQDSGQVHDGFLTAGLPVLWILRQVLLSWSSATSPKDLENILWDLVENSCVPGAVIQAALGFRKSQQSSSEAIDPQSKPALYICGHSVGGALAAMTGAMLLHPTLEPVREKLRSIYEFGAPMFADETYAEILEKELGERVFRHRYGKDMITLLPGRHRGDFQHFGREYVNSENGGWEAKNRGMGDSESITWSSIAILIGFLAWLKETAAILPRLSLPYSFPDHYPLHYLRASQANGAEWQLLGWGV
jgi:hypothetical protein